ncbi:hypothetical protein EMN47_09975 [Prolixibacteraceae bacterium JC049]|nr:hypothetical protein [Prolixibacteraceae bacterium JC049]
MKKILSLTIASVFAIFLCSKCDFTDPSEGLQLNVDYNIIVSAIGLTFVDAATQEEIILDNNELITVNISGKDKDKVLDATGEYFSRYEIEIGALSLAINPNHTIGESSPVDFAIEVKAKGYLTAHRSFKISEEGISSFRVELIKESTPPEGVKLKAYEDIAVVSGGVLQEEIIIGDEQNDFKIEIPESTVIKDADGNALTGKISVKQMAFSPTSEDALTLMPGGDGSVFTNAVTPEGNSQEIEFVSAGFFELKLTDESGKVAENFTNGAITVTYPVDEEVVNPDTNEKVKEGDEVPVWSFNEEEGEWKFEYNTTVKKVNGKLQFVAELDHLSYWNFDWWRDRQRCSYGGSINFTSSNSTGRYAFYTRYYDASSNRYLGTKYMSGIPNRANRLIRVPAGREVKFKVIRNYTRTYQTPAEFTINDLCSDNANIPLATASGIKNVTVNIVGRCSSNDDVIIRPTYWARLYNKTARTSKWVRINNGKATVNGLQDGDQLRVYVYYKGWHSEDITYDGKTEYNFDFDLPSDVCDNF